MSVPLTQALGITTLRNRMTSTHEIDEFPPRLLSLFTARKYSECHGPLLALAQSGSIKAAIMVAHINFHGGGGVRRDYRSAKHWLEIMEQDGDLLYAPYRLGAIHYRGLGVPSNHALAYRYFRKAGLKGDLKGLLMAASMQKDGDGTRRKPRSASALLSSLVRNRNAPLTTRLSALSWYLVPSWLLPNQPRASRST